MQGVLVSLVHTVISLVNADKMSLFLALKPSPFFVRVHELNIDLIRPEFLDYQPTNHFLKSNFFLLKKIHQDMS